MDLLEVTSVVFLDFQLAEFDKKLLLKRYPCFHGSFVVSGASLLFRILFVHRAIAINS